MIGPISFRRRACASTVRPGPLAWIIPALHMAAVILLTAQWEKRPEHWRIWAVLLAAATVLFIVAVIRLRPFPRRGGKC